MSWGEVSVASVFDREGRKEREEKEVRFQDRQSQALLEHQRKAECRTAGAPLFHLRC